MSLLLLLSKKSAAVKNPVPAPLNTTNTNNLGADGFTWAQAHQPVVDQYGKIATIVQVNASGLAWTVSNDNGSIWSDLASPGDGIYPVPVTRASIAYDSISDAFHVVYVSSDGNDGVIYRRYTPTRDGSHNITAMTKDANTNIQFDFNGSGIYDHPIVIYCNDVGSKGAIVAIWNAHKSGGGTEVRATMRALTNTSADGVAGNWTHLGVNSSDTISMAPAVAYTALFASASTSAAVGWPSVLRKSSGAASHAKDLYIFFVDIVATVPTWKFRRMAWATSNWSGGLGSAVTVGAIKRAGTDAGYTLKYQIGSKPVEDTTHDRVYFAYCDWKDNTNGDTWLFKWVDSADAVSSAVDVYSGLAANCGTTIFVTGDIGWDSVSKRLVVSYTDLPRKDSFLVLYDGSVRKQSPLNIFSSAPSDIPIILGSRINNKTIVFLRDFNVEARQNPPTYTPPYAGHWIPVSWR